MRLRKPELAYNTIALMIDMKITGRQVREFLENDDQLLESEAKI